MRVGRQGFARASDRERLAAVDEGVDLAFWEALVAQAGQRLEYSPRNQPVDRGQRDAEHVGCFGDRVGQCFEGRRSRLDDCGRRER